MNRSFASLSNKPFDLLVCGGGIYGAWTAYYAALLAALTYPIHKF